MKGCKRHSVSFLTGEELLNEGKFLLKIVDCGENHGRLQGYGQTHNWHKQSIFWELPYWKDHKLRHNLDVIHIKKTFLIISSILY